MNQKIITLGLDFSTQSVSACVFETDLSQMSGRILMERSVSFRKHPELNCLGIRHHNLLVPAREEGEADQPPQIFLRGLELVLRELADNGVDLGIMTGISVSAQQHAHLYLRERCLKNIENLNRGNHSPSSLTELMAGSFSYGTMPTWQTSISEEDAAEIRRRAGGDKAIISLSGSNSPARFTGAVMRNIMRRFPRAWEETWRVALLSNFISSILSGNPECPIDWGNGSGMSLMDYSGRCWSEELMEAAGGNLPGQSAENSGDAGGIQERLPNLAHPEEIAGTVCRYFVEAYGFSPECLVNVGSGDNPQSKLLSAGNMLSLGSSFVYMIETPRATVDERGYANSMYDGFGRPFMFFCRTNGAIVWDWVVRNYRQNFAEMDKNLSQHPLELGKRPMPQVWQPYHESLPPSPVIDNVEARTGSGDCSRVYTDVVDSSLILTRYFAREFENGFAATDEGITTNNDTELQGSTKINVDKGFPEPLTLTGGAAASPYIARRVATIFGSPVAQAPGGGGAGAGSALSALNTFCQHQGMECNFAQITASLVNSELVYPNDKDVEKCRGFSEAFIHSFRKDMN